MLYLSLLPSNLILLIISIAVTGARYHPLPKGYHSSLLSSLPPAFLASTQCLLQQSNFSKCKLSHIPPLSKRLHALFTMPSKKLDSPHLATSLTTSSTPALALCTRLTGSLGTDHTYSHPKAFALLLRIPPSMHMASSQP